MVVNFLWTVAIFVGAVVIDCDAVVIFESTVANSSCAVAKNLDLLQMQQRLWHLQQRQQ